MSQAGILEHGHMHECYGGEGVQSVVWEQFLTSYPLPLDFTCRMSAGNVDHVTMLDIKCLPHDHMTTDPPQW